ncbi:MAG TPA: hypothetical protein VHY33_07115, partial [Thermoanaerobaculia bacterium]|nr:hypothetical protein [Thermoanaerobaculia bacterium]
PSSPNPAANYALSISNGTIAVGSNYGVFKSTNGGTSWTGPFGPGASNVVAVDPANPSNIITNTTAGLLRTSNGGTNFTTVNSGFTSFYAQGIAVDPRNAAAVYAFSVTGIYKSADVGETWTLLSNQTTQSLAVDPFNSSILYATSGGTFRRSTDGGTSWQDFKSGLSTGGATFVAVDRQVQGVIYTTVGVSVYRKAGDSDWSIRNTGLPGNGFATVLVIDPNNSSTLYVAIAGVWYKTTNSGGTWTPANTGLTGLTPAGLSVDPFDSNHLFTWGSSTVFESTDGGANWTPFTLPPNRQAVQIVFDPTGPGRLYDSTYDGTTSPGARIDHSIDGGKTWSQMQTGLGRNPLSFFAVAPGGNTLYGGGTSGGVWTLHFARGRAVGR